MRKNLLHIRLLEIWYSTLSVVPWPLIVSDYVVKMKRKVKSNWIWVDRTAGVKLWVDKGLINFVIWKWVQPGKVRRKTMIKFKSKSLSYNRSTRCPKQNHKTVVSQTPSHTVLCSHQGDLNVTHFSDLEHSSYLLNLGNFWEPRSVLLLCCSGTHMLHVCGWWTVGSFSRGPIFP